MIGALLLWGVLAAPAPPLADEAFAWCHGEGHPLTRDEKAWCGVPERTRCPAFGAACAGPEAEVIGPSGRWQQRKAGAARTPAERDAEARGERRRAEGDPTTRRRREEAWSPPALRGLGATLFWIVIGVGALAVLVAVVRTQQGARRLPDLPPVAPPGRAQAIGGATARGPADVDALVRAASDFAARGEWQPALFAAHAAVLARLARDGLSDLRPARTHGDVLRDLRAAPALRWPARRLFREVERVRFGSGEATRAGFEAATAELPTLLGRTS